MCSYQLSLWWRLGLFFTRNAFSCALTLQYDVSSLMSENAHVEVCSLDRSLLVFRDCQECIPVAQSILDEHFLGLTGRLFYRDINFCTLLIRPKLFRIRKSSFSVTCFSARRNGGGGYCIWALLLFTIFQYCTCSGRKFVKCSQVQFICFCLLSQLDSCF